MMRKTLNKFLVASTVLVLSSCSRPSIGEILLYEADFNTSINSHNIELVTLRNGNIAAQFTNFGARLVSLVVPDRDGNYRDVVWGYSSIEEYLEATDQYSGPIVGRYGNRINEGKFSIDGENYQLTLNEGDNHIHGGTKGFSTQIWDIVSKSDSVVEMKYFSADLEEGYPGNATINVKYSLDSDMGLTIEYKVSTDAPTIVNPTSHAYFNLNGDSSSILEHSLMIVANTFTPTDQELIPTGEIALVKNTPMDFSKPCVIGERIGNSYEPLTFGGGYDHNWIFCEVSRSIPQVVLYSKQSGIEMTMFTNQPAVQFYSGNFMDGVDKGKRGNRHNYRSGIALEAQNYPDAPNHPNFPNSILRPNEEYYQLTTYKFKTIKN